MGALIFFLKLQNRCLWQREGVHTVSGGRDVSRKGRTFVFQHCSDLTSLVLRTSGGKSERQTVPLLGEGE